MHSVKVYKSKLTQNLQALLTESGWGEGTKDDVIVTKCGVWTFCCHKGRALDSLWTLEPLISFVCPGYSPDKQPISMVPNPLFASKHVQLLTYVWFLNVYCYIFTTIVAEVCSDQPLRKQQCRAKLTAAEGLILDRRISLLALEF